ncbi:MAG: hypothetical protein KDA24_04185 [Deltaproteobacteria bacterium]|nr:hypothetical protein [Deltaproteobacteria bacterium]
MRISVPLLLLLLVAGCAPPPPLTPVPVPTPGDDDDDAPLGPRPTLGTFAAAMRGEVDDTGAPSLIATKSEGTFQFLYWEEDATTPLCRQRLPFRAESRFGPLTAASCGGCSGMIEMTEVLPDGTPLDGEEPEDACSPEILAGADLSFLLTGDSSVQGRVSDFSHMALVRLEALGEEDWLLTPEGVHVEELIATYDAAGLHATHLAMVRPSGWLGEHGGLDSIASPWGIQGWLPMFVVYRDADRPLDADHLPGDVFLSSLWQVALAQPTPIQSPGNDAAAVE